MDLALAGRRALVTGGTRGIGRAIVEVLAEEGCRVSFRARDGECAQTTEAELQNVGNDAVADINDDIALARWVASGAEQLRGIAEHEALLRNGQHNTRIEPWTWH